MRLTVYRVRSQSCRFISGATPYFELDCCFRRRAHSRKSEDCLVKVLLLNNLYEPHVRGGAERSVKELAESLVRRNVDIVVGSTTHERLPGPSNINGVKVVYLPITNLYWPFDRGTRSTTERKLWHVLDTYNPSTRAAVARLIAAEQPDLVHTNNLQGLSVAAWRAPRAARVPILHTVRDYYLTCARCTRYRNGRICGRTCWDCLPLCLARKRASAWVDGVVGVSRFVLDHHRDMGFFCNARFRAVIHQVPQTSPLSRQTPFVAPVKFGYLGRLTPEKGVELLLEAFAARKDAGWELRIAGEGGDDYQRFLRRRYAALESRGVLHFLSWVNPERFFSEIDALIVPSLWNEPLARVVGEAFAAGVAVIASRSGGIPEIVEDGVSGRLFDSNDAAALNRIVSEFIEKPTLSRRLGENGRRASQAHRSETLTLEYYRAYQAILQSPGNGSSSR